MMFILFYLPPYWKAYKQSFKNMPIKQGFGVAILEGKGQKTICCKELYFLTPFLIMLFFGAARFFIGDSLKEYFLMTDRWFVFLGLSKIPLL